MTKLPSLKITVDEIRLQFEYERSRFDTLENKTNALLTIVAIIAAISALYFGNTLRMLSLLVLIIITCAVWMLSPRNFKVPLSEPDDYYKHAKLSQEKANDKILNSYISAIKHEKKINENKLMLVNALVIFIIFALIALTFLVTFVPPANNEKVPTVGICNNSLPLIVNSTINNLTINFPNCPWELKINETNFSNKTS